MADELYQKDCTRCGEVKLFSCFGAAKNGLHGLRGMCRSCYNAGRRVHYEKAHAQKMAIRREYESRPGVKERRLALRRTDERKAKERETMIRYKSKPEVIKQLRAYRESHESKPDVRARMLFKAALSRAQKQKIPFTISREWVRAKMAVGRCEVTGLPFDYGKPNGSTRRNAYCPSIDQIDAGKGYTPENCRLVLVAVNLALCDWGLDQFLYLAKSALEASGYRVLTKMSA